MGRVHLFEIEDQSWCPRQIRDAATDFLQFAIHWGNQYEPIVPLLVEALEQAGTTRVVDLCSGGGGPWSRLLPALDRAGIRAHVHLTDWFPNLSAFREAQRQSSQQISFEPVAVDATAVPPHLQGVRTVFTAFHHFPPPSARAILLDAVRRQQPIAVFEATTRSVPAVLGMLLSPVLVLLSTPFIRPLRLSRFLWTYVIPLVPLVVLWDGVVSCLRTYSVPELEELIATLPVEAGYRWDIGQIRGRSPIPLTYVIGSPVASA